MTACTHGQIMTEAVDQTVGVSCMRCGELLAWCWMDTHVPESLWNRACETDLDAVPCVNNRDDWCAICGQCIEPGQKLRATARNALRAMPDGPEKEALANALDMTDAR